MDLHKVGVFITSLRKEKGLTQKELAEKLNITDSAVSKWERGNSLPDTALLMPLCEFLGISITELLNGAKVAQQDAAAVAEKQIVSLLRQQKENRRKIFYNIVISLIGDIVLTGAILLAIFQITHTGAMIATLVVGSVIFLVSNTIAIMIDWDTGYLECRHCNAEYTKRRYKCPECKKWSFSKGVKILFVKDDTDDIK